MMVVVKDAKDWIFQGLFEQWKKAGHHMISGSMCVTNEVTMATASQSLDKIFNRGAADLQSA